MNFESFYQISLGLTVLFLFFISYNFIVDNFISFVVYKLMPFTFAAMISINAFIEAGYIVKV